MEDEREEQFQLAKGLRGEGIDDEAIILELRNRNASLIQTVLVFKKLGYELAYANELVLNSKAWSDEREFIVDIKNDLLGAFLAAKTTDNKQSQE